MTCPLGHEPMSRPERRRHEREIAKVNRAPGAGQGWRLSTGHLRRKYPVREPSQPIDLDKLIAESDAVAGRLGCTCVAYTGAI